MAISLAWSVVCAGPPSYAAPDATTGSSEAGRARVILKALEAGRLDEALIEAEGAAKRFPESALIQRREAQAHFCAAWRLTSGFETVVQDAYLDRHLTVASKWLNSLSDEERAKLGADPEKLHRLIALSTGNTVADFHRQSAGALQGAGDVLGRRSQLLSRALNELKAARRLGDTSTELELTELWCKLLVVLWRQEMTRAGVTASSGGKEPGGPANASGDVTRSVLEKALVPFGEIDAGKLLQSAAELGKQRKSDPAALAGAADIISVVASLGAQRDPLQGYITELLARRYLRGGSDVRPQRSGAAREAAQQRYSQALAAPDLDPVAAPTAMALQLYSKALEQDRTGSLTYLPLRVYLLRVGFDTERAKPLLDQLAEREPKNAVVELERARAALLLDDDPTAAVGHIRAAARLPEFSRSCLVAVPSALRDSLKPYVAFRTALKELWPSYEWLFITLRDAQANQKDAAAKMELRLARLKVADKLCAAPDASDQADGVHQKTLALTELLDPSLGLPVEQTALVSVQLEEHKRAFAGFPRKRDFAVLSTSGLGFSEYPQLDDRPGGAEGPQLWSGGVGGFVMLPDVRQGRSTGQRN
ncbi:MAG TPA: hypothetical protein VFU47_08040 [Armatimonadota bacterium]|nr:hypothetical protein [Armatimonadota bacterium]